MNKPKRIVHQEVKRLPIVRPSGIGKLVSGLQRQDIKDQIGFVHRFDTHEQDESDRK